ncbi:MAG: hypothetical protein PHH47_06560 [Gallionella sp.]|nr:hypothetical protein [Gallionella sp.]MDD4947790.1 hypothetical protein [Gallionella sp.]
MTKINEDRKRRRGPIPLEVNERRNHCVSVRLNKHELNLLDVRRSNFERGEWLRMAAIDQLPFSIPAVNREAWIELARLAANLNQFQTAINQGRASGYPSNFLGEVLSQVKALRRDLLGTGEPDEGNAKN